MAHAHSTLPILSLLILLSSSLSYSQSTSPKPRAFTFPINKDDASNQYYTTLQIGSNATTLNLVIDLGREFLWFTSTDYFNAASSFRPILCETPLCRLSNGIGCVFCFLSPPVPGCTNNTCSVDALNPFTGNIFYSGLYTDVLGVYSTGGLAYRVPNFPFQYANPFLQQGLAAGAAGVVGLGRTRVSLQAQLASTFNIRQKFSLCIPTSGNAGKIIVGDAAYVPPFGVVSETLLTTTLVRNPVNTYGDETVGNFSVEYFISVSSIRVGGTELRLNKTLLSIDKRTGGGGTNIRPVRAYTILHPSIFRALVNEFVRFTAFMNIKRVAAVAPFGACFDSKTIRSSKTGPDVPTIDLVFQSKNVYWRFYGSNSMVGVGNDVMCLAFVEGRRRFNDGPTTAIEVGGYQMENYLLEFEVGSSKLRFSSSLLLHDTSCSQFGAA